jgi:hypothetical protein
VKCQVGERRISSGRKVDAPVPSDENEQNFYISKLFIIRRSLYCLPLLLELGASKPEIWYSILVDPDPSIPLAGTQKIDSRQPPESVRVFFDCRK